MMKKFSWLSFVTVFTFILQSCVNDHLSEQNNVYHNVSKFKLVKWKEIPEVENFIYKNAGKKDLTVPVANASAKAKKINTGTLDTSTIVQKTKGKDVYYVFGVISPTTTDAVYTLEVKQTDGVLVKAEIIEYKPQRGTTFNYQHFTGSVTSYTLKGDPINSLDYNDGEGDCPPSGGPEPGYNGSDNPNPGGGMPYYGGSSSGTDPIYDISGCWDILLDPEKPWLTLGYYNNCSGQLILLNSKNNASDLSPQCYDGSGVVITSGTSNETPCEKIKKSTNDPKYKSNITNLEGKTGLDHEEGYRLGTPISGSGQTGTQNQLLQNLPGTHEVDMKIFSNTFALMHTHYDGIYPIFSPGDIVLFNNWIVWANTWNAVPTNTPKIPLNNLTLTVVTSNGNYLLAFDGSVVDPLPAYTQEQFDNLNKDYKEDYLDKTYTNGNFNMEKVEKEFLKFISERMNMTGLKLYRAKSDANYEISLSDLDGVKCP